MAGTALVTGLAGFTGHYVARELEALGYEVVGLGQGGALDGRHLSVDLRDARRLGELVAEIQPQVVVHLAAVAFVAHGDVSDIYSSNIVGTRNLLAALAACKRRAEKVLLASSANVYGNAEVPVLDESCAVQPENDYAVSKCAMELLSRHWRDDLPIVVSRPFNYTGVGQSLSFLLPKLVDHFARRLPQVELGNIDVYRDFSDVRTVADAYARLLGAGESGEVYNVCSGVSYSIQDILLMLAELAGYSIDVHVNPAFVRANEVKRLAGSNRKLAATIGELKHIPLRDTLQWMYRAQTGQ
ncbi:MAG: GDP-mannose 4,6-dehydratase [Halioglobus sp.]|nr:GDP-mannose 4,6-dehydratase [Halioglobus sp.]MCB1710233.1 GDP-mannose 4,6-dehydratase [Halioglobus sp.]MCP5194129.1 GDP-mannose 4,6-dehydratase [Pseudomonadales bacterium]